MIDTDVAVARWKMIETGNLRLICNKILGRHPTEWFERL